MTETMAHEPGLTQTPWVAGAPSAADTSYLHGNLIGSTERMTDASGDVVRRVVYTAFGEPVFEDGTVGTRFGYVGAWGYQGSWYDSGDPLADLGWLHVGARYYDSASGRFVQRDPIGMAGGPNTYVYAGNNPVSNIDPLGLDWRDNLVDFIAGALDILTFGLSRCFIAANESSGWYTAGEVVGFIAPIAGGVLKGVRAAAFRPGREFSHWYPTRMGGPRRWWNGNFVSPRLHHRTDSWRRLDRGWRYPQGIRQLIRAPYPISYGALGGLYSGLSAWVGGIGDD